MGGPVLVADDADVVAFGGGDEIGGEKGHVFIFESTFVILVVGAFVESERAGLIRGNFFASDRMVDAQSLLISFPARDFAERNFGIGREAIEHIVASVGSAGDAAEVIGMGGKDRFDGFPDGDAVFMESEFVEDQITGKATSGARTGGENFDAAGASVDGEARFEIHCCEVEVGREVEGSECRVGSAECRVLNRRERRKRRGSVGRIIDY